MHPRLLTGPDLSAFHDDTDSDMLALPFTYNTEVALLEGAPFGLLEYDDIQSPSFTRPEDLSTDTPVTLHNGIVAKILIKRQDIENGQWWEGAVRSDGTLDPHEAEEMAATLNSTTGLDQIVAVSEARIAMSAWSRAQVKTDRMARCRAQAIAKVARLAGQPEAGRLLNLNQSTVSRNVAKAQARDGVASVAAEPEGASEMFLAREVNPSTRKPQGDFWIFSSLTEAISEFRGDGLFSQFSVWSVPGGSSLFDVDCDDTWKSDPIYTGVKFAAMEGRMRVTADQVRDLFHRRIAKIDRGDSYPVIKRPDLLALIDNCDIGTGSDGTPEEGQWELLAEQVALAPLDDVRARALTAVGDAARNFDDSLRDRDGAIRFAIQVGAPLDLIAEAADLSTIEVRRVRDGGR